ncbi:MAG: hypothetical protein HUJ23_01000 [Methylophaga sp.]|nr:hypothetical protein [Methylophaga sp.]
MFNSGMPLFSRKLIVLIGLILSCSVTTGCATRVLMSSDRYEKPDRETNQWRSIDQQSRQWHLQQNIEQTYLTAVENDAHAEHSI